MPAFFWVKLRVSGDTIKCVARGSAQTEVEHHEIADIWKNRRVRVIGTIYYKALGQITQVECDAAQFLPPIALVEVLARNRAGGVDDQKVRDFFDNDYILLVNVDKHLGDFAR